VLPQAFVPVNTSVSAEPALNVFADVSTPKYTELQSEPNHLPQSVTPQPIIDEEASVSDEDSRERCVLESRKWDASRE
jgi:hypothetical protein